MNILSKFRGERSTVGLDIGTHSIKLAKIQHGKDGPFLVATGIKELKPGTIENGAIKDRDALIDAITTLINQCDPSIVDVVISMSGHGILSDKFSLKLGIDDSNVEETILWEAQQRSPFDVDGITLDYKILRRLPQSEEAEVLIVAAKNQIMQGYIDLLYEAGLKPVMVDVDAFAIYNCFCLESTEEQAQSTVLLLNIGHSLTTVTFIKDGVYHSARDIATAGDFFLKTLRRNLGVSEQVAGDIVKGFADPALDHTMIRQSIEYAAEELSSGLDLALSYFRTSEKSDKIDKIVLSGGGAYFPGIAQFLEKRHETTVQIANPLSFVQFEQSLFGLVNPQRISAFLTVAIGLALRKVSN
jgi:type IV pilus assembly protein PilM